MLNNNNNNGIFDLKKKGREKKRNRKCDNFRFKYVFDY